MKHIFFSPAVFLLLSETVCAEYSFDLSALKLSADQKKQLDLDGLKRVDTMIPGEYFVSLNINGVAAFQREIIFVSNQGELNPVLNVVLLDELGVNIDKIDSLKAQGNDSRFTDISAYIPYAQTTLDFQRMVLDIQIPQRWMKKISTQKHEDLDDGINAFFVDYNISGRRLNTRDNRTEDLYLNFNNGVNYGAWRLRHSGYYQQKQDRSLTYSPLQTYLERGLTEISSRITLGQMQTNSSVSESVIFQGIRLMTDFSMLSDFQRGYAPVVQGIAMSHAQVKIYQNNNVIYQTMVSPGEFVIDDFRPLFSQGTLNVEIREEDGTVRQYTKPYSGNLNMLRKEQFRYNLSVGKYQSSTPSGYKPTFLFGEMVYGLSVNTTLYTSLTKSENYRASGIGAAQGMGTMGVVSLDVAQAETSFKQGEKQHGYSTQAKYSKNVPLTNTDISLTGIRYSSPGYSGFAMANEKWNDLKKAQQQKSQLLITMNQSFGEYGYLSLSGSQQYYWGKENAKTNALAGSYSVDLLGVTLSFAVSNTRGKTSEKSENLYAINLSVPLGGKIPAVDMLSLGQTTGSNGKSQQTAMLAGAFREDRALSYVLSQTHQRDSQSRRREEESSVSLRHTGSQGNSQLGYSRRSSDRARQWYYGMQGAVLLHSEGMTLTPRLGGESGNALVRVKGLKGAKLVNRTVYTDKKGYSAATGLTPYRKNILSLDTNTLSDNVDVLNTIKSTTPSKGAIVLVDFPTQMGYRALIKLRRSGDKLPFGTIVSSARGSGGIVNERGEIYLNGLGEQEDLVANWGKQETCKADFSLKNADKNAGIILADLECS